MWLLVRMLALLLLAAAGLLLGGFGHLALDAADRVLALFGDGVPRPRADAPAPLTPAGTWAALGLGVLAAMARPSRRLVRQLVTLLHELGHTTVAAALGARPRGIVLRHDASGHATARWLGRPTFRRRLALAAVAVVGVPAAATFTATAAQLLRLAGPEAVLWTLAAAGAVVAVLARSPWSLLVAGGLVGLAVGALSETAEPWAAGVVVTLLTAAAVTAGVDDLRAVRAPIHAGDDARVVGRAVALPARLVQFVQVTVSTALSAWTLWLLAGGVLSR